ncbi:MAG: adenosylcobinamide-GDP ribazoletransferase, partial [Chloroflexi bacterium]|nr:adenosylcobinamide-GDP ribazoletransferase [Chloroflexota bacterium]
VGALLVIALLVLTRAIHIEGFLDSCDGLFGGYSREKRLEILRDTHVGAFAVIGGAALLILKWTLLTNLPGDIRVGLLIVFPCLSRFGMLLTMAAFNYVRVQGIGTAFQAGAKRWHVVFGLATAAIAGGALLGIAGLILLGAVIVVSLAMGRWISGMLGGMTGDTYGAVNEVAEVTVLIVGIAVFSLMPGLFQPPLW